MTAIVNGGPRDILTALGSPTALAILDILADGPTTADHIAGDLGFSTPAIRYHLNRFTVTGLASRYEHITLVGVTGHWPRTFALEADALEYAGAWLTATAERSRRAAP
jgi:DNA-binding transcriptional ArsR family regulator